MKEKENIKLFTPAGCLTLETMKRYSASSLSSDEKTQVENHLENCELCRDALEGLMLVSDTDKLESIVSEINENLISNMPSEKTARSVRLPNRFYYIAAAASVIILIGIFSYFKFYMQEQDSELSVVTEKTQTGQNEGYVSVDNKTNTEIADNKETEKPIPVAPEVNKEKVMENPVEDQNDIPVKVMEPDIKITMNETPVPESDDENIADVAEDVVLKQQSAIGGIEEPTEYVINGAALNGKGQNTERLSFNEDQDTEKKQFNSGALDYQQAKGKKGRSNFAVESVSNNTIEEDSIPDDEIKVFTVAETQPEYPGGQDALLKYIEDNLVYPDSAIAAGIKGNVYVSFIITETGKVEDAEVVRGIGGGCDEEALRLIKSMPDWIPGGQKGKPASVKLVLPVNFKLN